jgi:hypothetical protein
VAFLEKFERVEFKSRGNTWWRGLPSWWTMYL